MWNPGPRRVKSENKRRLVRATRSFWSLLSGFWFPLRNPVNVLHAFHVRQGVDAVDGGAGEGGVDVDLHEGVLAALFARAGQRSDVDPFLGDDLRRLGDHPWAVAIEEQQRGRVAFETRLEAIDLEDLDHSAAD